MFSHLRKLAKKSDSWEAFFQLANTGENVFGFRIFLRKIQTRGKHFSAANTGENVFELAKTCEKFPKMWHPLPRRQKRTGGAPEAHWSGRAADCENIALGEPMGNPIVKT